MNNIDITKELSQNFIDFSHEANCQRAFADARDGLKPGQRACLWEMYSKGYLNNKPHVKSAKISGGVIGTWWPHGDAAIYETFARMSQKWINNMPEVDWHGANGSIQISGEPAASRYTEARLSKIAEEGLLYNIKKNNVPMKLNFSEDEEWPQVLPALMPRLMINGCQGIGSTIANVWLPHNLKELSDIILKYIETEEIDYDSIAPDYPTGGIIINKNDLPNIYKTGKGKVILRGKADIQKDKILITEVPYQVYIEPFIAQIKELINKEEISGITNIINKSDKKKLLIEIECDIEPSIVLSKLYAKTYLQKSFSANQVALIGKTPKLLNLKEYLDVYLQHNYDCIKRENEYELNKAKDRLEIVQGLIKALENIDNIIALIKSSDNSSNAVQNLIEKYDFTERQAKAIVDMKLGRLTHLEKVELNKEEENLTSTINKCTEIIHNVSKQKEIYIDRFMAFVKKFGVDRRTQLANIAEPKKEKEIEQIIPEDVVVVVTPSGMIKRVPKKNFKAQHKNGKGIKNSDTAGSFALSTSTVDYVLIFTDAGKMYKLLVDKIPEGTSASKGAPLNTLLKIDSSEKIMTVTTLDTKKKYIVFFTKRGMIKKSKLEEYLSTKKSTGIAAIKLKEGDAIANIEIMDEEEVIIITKNGMSIRFKTEGISPIGRVAMGVKGVNLNEGDELFRGIPIESGKHLAIFCNNGLGKRVKIEDFSEQNRGGKGVQIISQKDNLQIVGAALVGEDDSVYVAGRPNSITINCNEIPVMSRFAAGGSIIKNSQILTVTKL